MSVNRRLRLAQPWKRRAAGVSTVAELVRWLKARGEEYAYAFENEDVVRAAIDHTHVKPDAPIEGAREIAFFPPMTGG